MIISCEKETFLHLPTPLEYLPSMSKELGNKLYIKRDDLTNLGAGGNKLRKLEYLLKDAKNKEATMLLTVGGAQTNHGRLTVAVAAKAGMKCAIACIDNYPGEISANILLDRIMGAEVVLKKSDGRPSDIQLKELVNSLLDKYQAQGEKVYYIPMGGSNMIGALGYYECAEELTLQAHEKDIDDACVITSVGSMGTYMGLFSGLKNEGSPLELAGVSILPLGDNYKEKLMKYYEEIKNTYDLKYQAQLNDFHIETGYMRGAYNNPCREVREAIYLMARKEAILLDPCYTGKCFAGIIDMVKEGKINQGKTIIFMHTGGMPGIYTKHHREEFERELIDGVTILQ
jgi:D-cysteine desulfhydrase family pyridoxal phosphate-dependent enzyme